MIGKLHRSPFELFLYLRILGSKLLFLILHPQLVNPGFGGSANERSNISTYDEYQIVHLETKFSFPMKFVFAVSAVQRNHEKVCVSLFLRRVLQRVQLLLY